MEHKKWIPTCRGGNILRQEVLSGQPLRTDCQNSGIISETSTLLNCLFVLHSLLTVTIHCTSNVRLFCTVHCTLYIVHQMFVCFVLYTVHCTQQDTLCLHYCCCFRCQLSLYQAVWCQLSAPGMGVRKLIPGHLTSQSYQSYNTLNKATRLFCNFKYDMWNVLSSMQSSLWQLFLWGSWLYSVGGWCGVNRYAVFLCNQRPLRLVCDNW